MKELPKWIVRFYGMSIGSIQNKPLNKLPFARPRLLMLWFIKTELKYALTASIMSKIFHACRKADAFVGYTVYRSVLVLRIAPFEDILLKLLWIYLQQQRFFISQ